MSGDRESILRPRLQPVERVRYQLLYLTAFNWVKPKFARAGAHSEWWSVHGENRQRVSAAAAVIEPHTSSTRRELPAMPKKPNRPIGSMVFPKSGSPWLKLDQLSTDKDELELEIAERFVSALAYVAGEQYLCKGRAPEPGDILLQDEDGNEIYLQIGEAVDKHRTTTTSLRKRYGSLIWTSNPDLRDIYRGVQVALIDAGEARDLPPPSSKSGRCVLEELSNLLRSLVPVVNSLPNNEEGKLRGKETRVDASSISMQLYIRLLRYAPPTEKHPAKWLWTGTHQIRTGDNLERFTEVIDKKSRHYADIDSPFWLMVYSVDSHCEFDEQLSLFRTLTAREHPFDRVYLFFPIGSRGDVRELFPSQPKRIQSESTDSKKLLLRMMPEDAIPKWDDPRWQTV